MEDLLCYTGFWKERLEIFAEEIEENPDIKDDFSECSFGFMENENNAFSNDDIDKWAEMITKTNHSINREMALAIVKRYSAYDFLHGDCNIFAQYLHEKYGYKVEAVFDGSYDEEKPRLVHMYCVHEPEPGYKVYVDVRGKCNDFEHFMAEFYDNGLWDNDDYSSEEEFDGFPKKYKASEEDIWRLEAAERIDDVFGYYAPYAG